MNLTRDELSVRLTLDDDPLFFMCRMTEEQGHIISALNPGSQTMERFEVLFRMFLDMSGGYPPAALILQNVDVDAGGDAPSVDHLPEAVRTAHDVLVGQYDAVAFQADLGKTDMVFSNGSAQILNEKLTKAFAKS